MSKTHYDNIFKYSSRFPSNSEVDASELLRNLEEVFSRYYMNSNMLKYSSTHSQVTHAKGLKDIPSVNPGAMLRNY